MESFSSPEKVTSPRLRGEVWWQEQIVPPLDRAHFELQYEIVRIMAEKIEEGRILRAVNHYAPLLRKHIYDPEEERMRILREGVTEDNMLTHAYKVYLEEHKRMPTEYHPKHSHEFGCFSYTVNAGNEGIHLHFTNREAGSDSPLDEKRSEARRDELSDLVEDIVHKFPQVKKVQGYSWLYHLPRYRALFPAAYATASQVAIRENDWSEGSRIWGQFVVHGGGIRKEMRDELVARARALPHGEPLSTIFDDPTCTLMPPLRVEGSFEEFRNHFEV